MPKKNTLKRDAAGWLEKPGRKRWKKAWKRKKAKG
jgi:hypothetical protein